MTGVVVCVDPRAADEGTKVLEAGGNAFDAAIATAFVQMVVTPFSCGVGGMASAHLWKRETAQHFVVDGLLRAGSLVTDDMWAADYRGESEITGGSLFEDHRSDIGYTSVCTPGTVAALSEVHRELGSLPWRDLLAPAADIARRGFMFQPVTPTDRDTSSPHRPDSVTRVQATPDCARLYYRDDEHVPADGVLVQNPDYASTIDRLAEHGAADLYEGDLADAVATDLAANGSFVTRDDLRSYSTNTYAPAFVAYRGLNVWTNAPPGGGPLLIEALKVLGGLDLASLEHSGAQHLAYLASTLQLVNQDRRNFVGDPDFLGPDPFLTMTAPERAAEVREAVVNGVVGGELPQAESPDTTHLTVVDGDGNVAAITHTNGAHSGVVTPGLGFVYNNGMARFDPRPGRASSLAPGKARLHLTMPTIVFKDSSTHIVLGAPGGNAILSALVQTLSNVVDFGMSAVEAVSATRIHAEGPNIWCEARVRADVVADLRERGFNVIQDTQVLGNRLARAQAVIMKDDGTLDGASDLRGASGVVYARGN